MRMNRTVVSIVVVVALAVPTIAGAQAAGRLAGKVVDHEGNPIAGVEVTVTSPDLEGYEEHVTTNKKGRFVVAHTDATLSFTYRFVKGGFEPLVERVRVQTGGVTQQTFTLLPAGSASRDQPLPPRGQSANAFNAGVEAQNAGDLETAAERYRRAAELDPTFAAPHTALAGVLFLQERWPEAAAEAEAALELDPSDGRALQIRYEAYRQAGDADKAAESAAALRRAGIGNEAAGRAYNEAVDAYKGGDLETARRLLEEAVAVDPDLTQSRLFLAAIYREQGDIERAATEVDGVLAREPDDPMACRLGFEIAAARGDWQAENAAAEHYFQVDPENAGQELFQRGVELYDGDHFAEAATMMQLVLRARPDEARAHFVLGMASFNLGDTETARTHLTRFVELAPDDPDAAIAHELLQYSN